MAGASAELAKLCKDLWVEIIKDSPEFGAYRGYDFYPKQLDSYTCDKFTRRKETCERLLKRSKKIRESDLDKNDGTTYKILQMYLESCLRGLQFPVQLLVINNFNGPHKNMAKYMSKMKVDTAEGYENYMERIGQFPTQIEGLMNLLRSGIEQGIVHTLTSVDNIPDQIEVTTSCLPETSKFYRPPPETLTQELKQTYEHKVPQLIEECALRPLRRLEDFMIKEYFPRCRPSLSMSTLPNGDAWYRAQLQFHCDTNIPPEEMHQLGLREVQHLKDNIHRVMSKVGFQGTMRKFVECIRSKEEFSFQSEEDLVEYCYHVLESEIRPAIKQMFDDIPEVPLKMHLDPYPGAPALAVYHAPSEVSPVGEVWFSGELDMLKKFSIFTLLLHETEPGHHYQACYTFHDKKMPEFRRHKNDLTYCEVPGRFPMNSAYTEGWGLYCEDLGQELGLYNDPYTEFGFHDQNIKRAARMVVDTGIHALGWSREEAFIYMMENTTFSEEGANSEITRYGVGPGQSCSYKFGHLRIKEIRRHAEQELGTKFDIRKFHEECLRHGQIPLQILEEIIENYIAETKTGTL